jgi:hypothetical protein
MALYFIGLTYGCNLCFHGGEDCHCTKSKCLVFFVLRSVLVVVVVLSSLVPRIVGFSFDIDFDWTYPQWSILSLVSWIDLDLSTLMDIYLTYLG